MDEFDVVWPVALKESLKQRMLEIAVPLDTVSKFEVSADYWKVDGLFYIQSGLFTLGYTAEALNVTISAIVGPRDWIGVNSLFHSNGKQFLLHSFKLTPVRLLYFPRDKLEHLANEDPELYKLFFHLSSTITPHWLKSALVCFHERKMRLAFTLLTIFNKQNVGGARTNFILNISQQQLSSVIGISRPRINESLKELEREGLIAVKRGKIVVHDVDGLTECIEELDLLLAY